ncbi:hypothetical protein MJ1_0618 [Nanobdella aerobiophila]|uniref:Small zinc finger protein HVO-2753-like zinc-binding pocket domain-containing protein n=1 Tax=Nanobdella aerobiophila TaxID=2586965 RepID=A0A915SFI3_9ARCH|nr:zinc finger domain-containing protein [Nanobdella aerobiophila]BBL45765.1 hypothetical protein MJ1_0618 [Nanobdella aerobiophila]
MDIDDIKKTNNLRKIIVGDTIIKFPCPKCGEETIIRSNREKLLGLEWQCSKCGFIGP